MPKIEGFFKTEESLAYKGLKKINTCSQCGLFQHCKSKRMTYHGKGEKGILFIGDSPKISDDKNNDQFTSDREFRTRLKDFDFNLDNDGYKYNAINCCLNDDEKYPTDQEINYCRPNVIKAIETLKPKKVILLGMSAIKSVIGNRMSVDKMKKWVGHCIPDQDLKCWLFTTYHPSFVYLKNNDKENKVLIKIFEDHIERALEWKEEFPNYGDEYDKLKILVDKKDIYEYLLHIMAHRPKIAFDFETTGIKPHRKGHKIICMSISENEESAVSFPFDHNDPDFLHYIKNILGCSQIKKICQNINMESMWTRVLLGYELEGIYFDTMIGTHFLDNRKGITGLKRQAYLQFGIPSYDAEIEQYMRSISKEESDKYGDNAFNKLPELWEKDPKKLLLYNAMDSMMTYRLDEKQIKQIVDLPYKGYNLLLEGVNALCDTQCNGIKINTRHYRRHIRDLEKRMTDIHDTILNFPEARKYKHVTGKELNPNSDAQLKALVYNICKLRKKPLEGKISVDQNVLKEINTNFSRNIISLRTLKGINDKAHDILKEAVDFYMHPSFSLNIAATYRSSAYSPNLQNMSKHDKLAKKIIRSGIIPSEGNMLGEADYSKAEVHMGLNYHKDPKMYIYLTDNSTNMHRDTGEMLFLLNRKQITKPITQISKNQYVFATFYGSFFRQTAISLWKAIQNENLQDGTRLITHLKNKGINNYSQFEKHVATIDKWLWEEQFVEYNNWRKATWEKYQKTGYIDLLTGFRCQGLMRKNEVLNFAIQGSSFHCLLWSLIKINKQLKTGGMKTKIIGQIHDSILFDIYPPELDMLKKMTNKIMTEDIREYWDWIIVPLKIELEVSEINGSWFDMKEIEP